MKKDIPMIESGQRYLSVHTRYTPGSSARIAEELEQRSGSVFQVEDIVDRGCVADTHEERFS